MKAKTLLLFSAISVLFVASVFSQAPEIEWQKNMGGTFNDWGRSIHQTIDGGYIAAGYTSSVNGDVNGNHGGQDFWVVKMDNGGNMQWQKCLGGSEWDFGSELVVSTDGGYVITGATASEDGDVIENKGGDDFWVVKLDAEGNIIWQKTFGGTDHDYPNAIQQTMDGGYIVAGSTGSNDGDVSGNHGDLDFWVVKLDDSGNMEWQQCYGGSYDEEAYTVRQTTDGGYVVAGYSDSDDSDVTGNNGGSDVWLVKLDTAGNMVWQKNMGGLFADVANFILQSSDGGFVVAASTNSNEGDASGNHGIRDAWLLKLDDTGNILWQKCYGGTSYDGANSVQQTTDGGYVVACYAFGSDGDVIGNHGLYDFWILKLDIDGDLLWQKCMGGTGSDYAWDIRQTTDGGFIVTGSAESNDGDVTGNNGYSGLWVVKLSGDSLATGIVENALLNPGNFSLFPNPGTSSFAISFSVSKSSDLEINLLDLHGRNIQTIAKGNFSGGNHQLNFSALELPDGIYLIKLHTNEKTFFTKLIKQ